MPTDLQRCDVFDANFQVVLRGTGPEDLVPFDGRLEDDLVTEVRQSLKCHDFVKQPTAMGLFGEKYRWYLSLIDGGFFALLLERSKIASQIESFARSHFLSTAETDDLRFIVGNYDLTSVADRDQSSIDQILERYRDLVEKLGLPNLRALITAASQGERTNNATMLKRLSHLSLGSHRLTS